MKKKVEVILTHEIELEIKDECLTPQFIAAFESTMFELDPYSNFDNPVDALFAFAARRIAIDGVHHFIEGIGQCVGKFSDDKDAPVRCLSDDDEAEENIRA